MFSVMLFSQIKNLEAEIKTLTDQMKSLKSELQDVNDAKEKLETEYERLNYRYTNYVIIVLILIFLS